jgi:hypothetical protein
MATREFIERMRKTYMADGRWLEAYFLQFRLDYGLEKADPERLRELRRAFLTGAERVYTMMTLPVGIPPIAVEGGPAPLATEHVLRQLKLREEIGRFLIELLHENKDQAPDRSRGQAPDRGSEQTPDVTGHA